MDESGLMDGVMSEFMRAMETKDKALLMDALSAIVLHVCDEDENQESAEGA